MTKSPPLVFFGNERLATGVTLSDTPALRALIKTGYDIKAVVSNFARGTSRSARQLEIESTAKEFGIPVLLPAQPADILQQLKELNAQAAVLVAYGRIVPQTVIDIFPKGIINIHPSLLPAYRGPTPIEQTILDGVQQTGVSLMQLHKKMDAGPVFAQTIVPLNGTETKNELAELLLNRGKDLLIQNLPGILDGSVTPAPQDDSKATYTRLISKNDGQISTADTAEQLARKVRAYAGWPKSQLNIKDIPVIVTQARAVQNQESGALVLPCADNTYIEIEELLAPSGRKMNGEDFLRGYGNR